MKMYTKTLHESNDDIAQLVAQNHHLSKNVIFPFADFREFITELFVQHDCDGINIISAGTSTPVIAIAADKANITLKECIGKNPFAYSFESLIEATTNGDILYISNPNRISGANFSLTGLKKIAEMNYDGLIIIDEYYFDFYGISGLKLIEEYNNIVILRSFTAAFGIYSSDAGYAVSSKKIIEQFKELSSLKQISTILRKTILATMSNSEISNTRLTDIRDESLRITQQLTLLGVQCRITATDFLLMRVASPKDVGNFLTTSKVAIENLSGYPQMKNYIRFRIESFFSNERLLKAFKKMPKSFYEMKSVENRTVTINRPSGEKTKSQSQIDVLLDGKIKERSATPQIIDSKHLFKIAD